MGLLSTGASWLAGKLMEHASESVTYTRGANSVTVNAVIGRRKRREQKEQQQVVLVGEPMEFQFDPAELILNGLTITPARGDRIAWSGRVYDVRPHEGDAVTGPSDAFGNLIVAKAVRSS